MKEYLEFAQKIALEAGKIMIDNFNEIYQEEYKEDKSIVTEIDKKINSYLIEEVKKNYPTHAVFGEEESFGESNYVWVCDPIDGTMMYKNHIPVSVFSLALVIDGISSVGVIYNPFTKELYYAIRGEGAYVNDKKIEVSKDKMNGMKTVCHLDEWPTQEFDMNECYKEIKGKTYSINIGSIIHAATKVAKGEFIFALFPGTSYKNCDLAALKVVVEEAGGRVTNLYGEEERYDQTGINGAIISNQACFIDLLELTKYIKRK